MKLPTNSSPSANMIIYKDIFTGDELFTDIFNPKPEDEDFIITVDAKMTKRKTDEISDAVFGGNASQEEQSEQVDDAQDQQGLDIVLNHKLEDVTSFFADKKSVTSYMKKYCKNLAAKLDEGDCEGDKEKCKKFKACCSGGKLANFVSKWSSDTSVFVGEHMDYFAEEKACLLLGNWGEDGMTVKFYCLSDGLHVEKQ